MIYPKRYEAEPRKRIAYCDACDMIAVYGIKRTQWKSSRFYINNEEASEIWKRANEDMNGRSRYDMIYRR